MTLLDNMILATGYWKKAQERNHKLTFMGLYDMMQSPRDWYKAMKENDETDDMMLETLINGDSEVREVSLDGE